jgi:hypothetical protein
MIADAAVIDRAPAATAAATCGCAAGRDSPLILVRGAVLSPTCTSLIASPTLAPVVAWISATGERKPCFLARSRPELRPRLTGDLGCDGRERGVDLAHEHASAIHLDERAR